MGFVACIGETGLLVHASTMYNQHSALGSCQITVDEDPTGQELFSEHQILRDAMSVRIRAR